MLRSGCQQLSRLPSSLVADERSQRSSVRYLNLIVLKSHVPTGLLNIESLVNNLFSHRIILLEVFPLSFGWHLNQAAKLIVLLCFSPPSRSRYSATGATPASARKHSKGRVFSNCHERRLHFSEKLLWLYPVLGPGGGLRNIFKQNHQLPPL